VTRTVAHAPITVVKKHTRHQSPTDVDARCDEGDDDDDGDGDGDGDGVRSSSSLSSSLSLSRRRRRERERERCGAAWRTSGDTGGVGVVVGGVCAVREGARWRRCDRARGGEVRVVCVMCRTRPRDRARGVCVCVYK